MTPRSLPRRWDRIRSRLGPGHYHFIDLGWRCNDGDEFDTLREAIEHVSANDTTSGAASFWPVLTITFPPRRVWVKSLWEDAPDA